MKSIFEKADKHWAFQPINQPPIPDSEFQNFIDAFTVSGKGFGGTYIGKIPGLRIDYIWHDKSLGSTNFVVHHQKLSDHKAISTEILL